MDLEIHVEKMDNISRYELFYHEFDLVIWGASVEVAKISAQVFLGWSSLGQNTHSRKFNESSQKTMQAITQILNDIGNKILTMDGVQSHRFYGPSII